MAESENIAIRIEGVTKTFRLPHEKQTSLKSAFLNSFKRKSYENQTALEDISFEIKKGEFFGIVGRNGSGKSTLLKCMAGVYVPNKGTIKINGRLVPFIELGVGFNPELTGRDNVYLNGALLGFSRKQMDAMYDDIVVFAELEHFMDAKLKNYSSGMQVRLAFSIAIRAEGDILLLDEVLAVGDTAFQRKCLDYFKQIKKSKKTVILVSHSMGTIEEFCDRALMLEDSRIVAIGEPMKISAEYEMANSVYVQHSIGKKVSKPTTKERPKDPDITIRKVDVYSDKAKTTQFTLTDDIIIEVEVDVVRPQAMMLSAVIHDMNGELIAGVNSSNEMPGYIPPKGRATARCVINAGQFPSGPYRITVNVIRDIETPEIIDVASHEFGVKLPILTFTEKSAYKKGKFYMAAHWQMKDQSK